MIFTIQPRVVVAPSFTHRMTAEFYDTGNHQSVFSSLKRAAQDWARRGFNEYTAERRLWDLRSQNWTHLQNE